MVNAEVYVFNAWELEKAILQFHRQVKKSELQNELAKRQDYVPKSQRRKNKSLKARARQTAAVKKWAGKATARGDIREGPDSHA